MIDGYDELILNAIVAYIHVVLIQNKYWFVFDLYLLWLGEVKALTLWFAKITKKG